MFELAMTALNSNKIPAVCFQQLDQFPYFHSILFARGGQQRPAWTRSKRPRSSEQPGNIVVKGDAHQGQEHDQAQLLADQLLFFRERFAQREFY